MDALIIKNLHKNFAGLKVIDGLSMNIPKGKIIGLIGPNGSGKTTLINILSGQLERSSGEIIFHGINMKKINSEQLPDYGLTRTFQNINLFEQMTVLDNILVVLTSRKPLLALREYANLDHIEKARNVLEAVGLWDKKNSLAAKLSYGQRKLLEIGRVLAMDVESILLDEPFAGLFKEKIKEVVKIIQNLQSQGKTIILVEHNMELIRELCNYIFVLDEGRVLASGEPDQVLNQKNVISAYLGD